MNETRRAKNGRGRQIDYILVQRNLSVMEQKIEFQECSDHRPLSVKLKIKQENLFQIPVIKAGRKVNSQEDYLFLCNTPKQFDIKYIEYNYVFKRNIF